MPETQPSNPFGGNKPLPGGGGSYLSCTPTLQPARHIVMIEKLQYKPPGFKALQGAAIGDFQILATDSPENHKVGASYSVYHDFAKSLGKGNCVVDLAGFRSVVLGRPVQPAEITDDMLAASYGVPGFSLETADPEAFAILGANGYRGTVLVAICANKITQAKTNFTVTRFVALGDSDITKIKRENPDLYAQLYPDSAAG